MEKMVELARHDPAPGLKQFVSKFVSETAHWAGFVDFYGL
jgi:hypothetical protein